MAELTISTLIKIILGVIVVVTVIIFVSLFFKNKIFGFFKGLPGNESAGLILFYLKNKLK